MDERVRTFAIRLTYTLRSTCARITRYSCAGERRVKSRDEVACKSRCLVGTNYEALSLGVVSRDFTSSRVNANGAKGESDIRRADRAGNGCACGLDEDVKV